MMCALCNGPLMFLGRLGILDHYRCRNCGADCSCEAVPEPEPERELLNMVTGDVE